MQRCVVARHRFCFCGESTVLKFQALRILVSSAWNYISKRLEVESRIVVLKMRLRCDKHKLLSWKRQNRDVKKQVLQQQFNTFFAEIIQKKSFLMFFNQLQKIKVQESFRNSTLSFRKGSEIVQFCCIQTAICVFFCKARLNNRKECVTITHSFIFRIKTDLNFQSMSLVYGVMFSLFLSS